MTKHRAAAALAIAVTAVLLVVVVAATAAPRQAKAPIKIGVDVSLTGGFAALGLATKNGIVMRARQINAKGGVNGRKIQLTILDDGTNPANAISNANRLIDGGADAIIGFNGGLTQVPASGPAIRANVLTVALSGANAGQTGGPAYFWASPTLATHVAAIGCYITKVSKPKKVGILATNDAGAQGMKNGLSDLLDKASISVASETVPLGASDVTVAVSKIRDSNPSLVFNTGVGATGGLIAKTVRDIGMKGPIMGWLSWQQAPVLKLYQSALNGVVMEGFISQKDPLPHQVTFVNTWVKNYPAVPVDSYGAWGYDSVTAIGEAFRAVPNATQKDGVKLGQALEKATFHGVVGSWKLGAYDANNPEVHTGMHSADVVWLYVQNGDLRKLKVQPNC